MREKRQSPGVIQEKTSTPCRQGKQKRRNCDQLSESVHRLCEGSYFFGFVSQNSADASSSLSSTNQPNTATDLQTLRHGSLLIGRATDSDYAAVYPILHNFPRLCLCLRPSSSPSTERVLQICIPAECELPIRPCLKRTRWPALELTTIPPTDVDIVVLV